MPNLFEPRRVVALLFFVPLACGGGEVGEPHPTAPVVQSLPSSSGGSGRNLAMGTGEPLNPAPFTLQDRYLEAARQGDRATLERALELGAKLDAKDDLGRSALLLAVRDAGNLDVMLFLQAKGAPVDEPDVGGRTALSWAAGAGRLDLVRELERLGAKPDRPDREGRTPLFHAVLDDHRDVVVFLLERGATVNAPDQYLDTPLIMACAKGFGPLAALLLQRGADPTLKNQEGRTARDRAAEGTEVCLGKGPGQPTPAAGTPEAKEEGRGVGD